MRKIRISKSWRFLISNMKKNNKIYRKKREMPRLPLILLAFVYLYIFFVGFLHLLCLYLGFLFYKLILYLLFLYLDFLLSLIFLLLLYLFFPLYLYQLCLYWGFFIFSILAMLMIRSFAIILIFGFFPPFFNKLWKVSLPVLLFIVMTSKLI